MEIISFGNKETEAFVTSGKLSKNCRWSSQKKVALRKIDMIIFADNASDLRIPPSNRLEKLKGDLKGYWSIRINDKFRIVFSIENNLIGNIKITDYH